MNREEVVKFINDKIEEEYGDALEENQKIIDSNMDSFGITMLFLEIENNFGIYKKKEFEKIEFEKILLKDVVDRVMESQK